MAYSWLFGYLFIDRRQPYNSIADGSSTSASPTACPPREWGTLDARMLTTHSGRKPGPSWRPVDDDARVYAHVSTRVYSNVYTQVYSHVYTHVHSHVYTQVYSHVYTQVYSHVYAQVYSRVYALVCSEVLGYG